MTSKFIEKGVVLKKQYVIMKQLGEGAYGQVFLAKDTKNNRKVAVKLVKKKKPVAGFDGSCLGEARILNILHGCIGTPVMFDYLHYKEFNIIVMELCKVDLGTLLQNARRQYFSPKVTLHILRHLVVVVEAVHSYGVIHRDIKLGNLMIPLRQTPSTKIILGDFGMGCKFETNFTKAGRRLRVPSDDYAFKLSPYHSIGMSQYRPAQEKDDMEMICYTLLETQGVQFDGSAAEMLQKKQDFVADPSSLLNNGKEYLVETAEALLNQVYGEIPNYSNVIHAIDRQNCVSPFRNFSIKKSFNGKLTLRDF